MREGLEIPMRLWELVVALHCHQTLSYITLLRMDVPRLAAVMHQEVLLIADSLLYKCGFHVCIFALRQQVELETMCAIIQDHPGTQAHKRIAKGMKGLKMGRSRSGVPQGCHTKHKLLVLVVPRSLGKQSRPAACVGCCPISKGHCICQQHPSRHISQIVSNSSLSEHDGEVT